MRAGGVNMLHLPSESYAQVQDQIFGLVAAQLPPSRVTHTVGRPFPGALNWVLHIRTGRGRRQVAPPAQVLMSHGLADKSYLFLRSAETGLPLVNSFEHVLVPGEWARRRLLERRRARPDKRVLLDESRIHVVGWPRLDPLVQAGAAERGPVSGRPLRLLWAPSHDTTRVGPERRALSSYPAFEPYLPRLRERFDVRVSLHPANRSDKTPTGDALAWADVVVSDFGTLLYEAWALRKCVVMPTFLLPPEIATRRPQTAEAHVYRERIGSHAGSFEELVEMAAAAEPPGSDVERFLADFLAPQYLGCSSRRIAEVLDALAPTPSLRSSLAVQAREQVLGPLRRVEHRVRLRVAQRVRSLRRDAR